jgi:hypothetical protein
VIKRYEPIVFNQVTRNVDSYGDATVTETVFFRTAGLIFDIENELRLQEQYRLYADFLNVRVSYTPNTVLIAEDQENYSITWRNLSWRITDSIEANDRMTIRFIAYRSKPGVQP